MKQFQLPSSDSIGGNRNLKHHLSDAAGERGNDGLSPIATTSSTMMPPCKRLRGGGGADDYDGPTPQDYYDEMEEEDYMQNEVDVDVDVDVDIDIPEEEDYDHSQNSNLSWTDRTDTATDYSQLSPQQLQRWSRRPLPKNMDNKSDLHFQWLDIDMTQHAEPLKENPNEERAEVIGASGEGNGPVPVIRIYGVTEEGYSIVTFLHGYTPYGYFALPEGYVLDCGNGNGNGDGQDEALGKIRSVLNDALKYAKASRRGGGGSGGGGDLVQGVEYIEDHRSIMGYNTAHTRFLKVFLQMPTLVPTLKRIMEGGIALPHIVKEGHNSGNDAGGSGNGNDMDGGTLWDDDDVKGQSYQPFECNVPFVLRFMIDEDVNGADWITLPKGTYQLKTKESGQKTTHCQV